MFITDEEAARRLNSSRNVLTVIDKDGANGSGVPHEREPLVIETPDLPVAEDETCASALGVVAPNGATLRRMLGMGSGAGRKPGATNMAMETRAATAVCAQLTTLKTAASIFDTSVHHAHELKHGFTNEEAQYGYSGGKEDPNKLLEKVINDQKRKVRDLAFEKLTKTLGLISDDKLTALTDPTKLGRLAKDLSVVVDKVLPKQDAVLGGVHFHVWRPEMREESTYETINVGSPV